jgi:predicted  nucleic acid-binding Zn-ribbon protein
LGKHLKLLEELQGVDLKLDTWRGEKEALISEVALLGGKVDDARAAIEQKNAELAATEEEKTVLEENIAAEVDNILKSETRLKDIKTQKEYQAVSKEIVTAKKVKGELEEQILQKLTQAEEMKAEISVMETNCAAMATEIDVQQQELKARIESLEAGISSDAVLRNTTAKAIPASVMKRYDMLREKRQGLAVVEARNGSCLGCNMNLPPQVYNNLFKKDSLITCPHCQRILFLREPEGEAGE